jgi:HEPN domain-containing protein
MNQDVNVWLAAAAEDYDCAKELKPRHRGPIAYHLQQATEKLLKALLVAAEIEPPRTQDLKDLWTLLSRHAVLDDMTPKTAENLTMLSRFNWIGRYPLGRAAPSENILVREIEQAFQFVTPLKDKVTRLLECGPMEADDERPSPWPGHCED